MDCKNLSGRAGLRSMRVPDLKTGKEKTDAMRRANAGLLGWLFHVAQYEDRPDLRGVLRAWIYGHYRKADVDSYLYYKVYTVNLVLNLIASSLFWLSRALERDIELGFYTISYSDHFVDVFIREYPEVIFPILMATTVVYSLLLFAMKSPNFLRGSVARQYAENSVLRKNGPLTYLGVFIFSVGGMALLFWLPEYFRRYSLYDAIGLNEQTAVSLFIVNFAYLFFYQLFVCNGIAFGLINFIDAVYRRHFAARKG